jgi:hypothetical protein
VPPTCYFRLTVAAPAQIVTVSRAAEILSENETLKLTVETAIKAMARKRRHTNDGVEDRSLGPDAELHIGQRISNARRWQPQIPARHHARHGFTCDHPGFVFNQFGELERCALRPGNVHTADGWEGDAQARRGTLPR